MDRSRAPGDGRTAGGLLALPYLAEHDGEDAEGALGPAPLVGRDHRGEVHRRHHVAAAVVPMVVLVLGFVGWVGGWLGGWLIN